MIDVHIIQWIIRGILLSVGFRMLVWFMKSLREAKQELKEAKERLAKQRELLNDMYKDFEPYSYTPEMESALDEAKKILNQ